MAKVVKWDITLDNSIERIGLIVGEEQPAIEVNARFKKEKFNIIGDDEEKLFLKFLASEQGESYTFQVGDEAFEELRKEMIVAGPALIPNKLILRFDDEGEDFYGYFSEQAVRNAAYSFQKHKLVDQFNINHEQDNVVEGVFVAESWIVEDPENDQSRIYGYNLPEGSWFIKLKVQNEELYNQLVGDGEMNLNGFSIETALLERVIFSKQGK